MPVAYWQQSSSENLIEKLINYNTDNDSVLVMIDIYIPIQNFMKNYNLNYRKLIFWNEKKFSPFIIKEFVAGRKHKLINPK